MKHTKKCRAMVIRTAGTNCDTETVYALRQVGAQTDLVHINEIFSKKVQLEKYSFLIIPGGFSYGDDIASGRVFANQFAFRIGDQVKEFVKQGKLILGICNGFQVLVKSGFLPGNNINNLVQTVSLSYNDSDKFEDRWIYLKKNSKTCVFTKDLPDTIFLPVAHAEGKFMYTNEVVGMRLLDEHQVVFQYVDSNGKAVGYPGNPNGSLDDIAGICNRQGTVMGMMPHPERYISKYQHPRWTREHLPEEGVGLQIFKNAVTYIRENL
ncbi:MAG: phosphoribosylformylglycinamidine synthase I [bacterium]